MQKEALLLIDIHDIYFTPGELLLHRPEDAADKAAAVLERFRQEKKTVIHVRHNFETLSEINERVRPVDGEKTVCKDYPSSFLKTDMREYLEENKIEKIVIVGMMSHMCVDTTARACQDYGYDVTVIEDACTTLDLEFRGRKIPAQVVHDAYMASLDGMFAKVMTLEEYTRGI